MWYIWFFIALVVHVAISAFLGWRFRTHTAYCTVPDVRDEELRAIADSVNQMPGTHYRPSEFKGLFTTTTEKWATPRWVGNYFVAGLALFIIILTLHLLFPATI